MKNRIRFQKRFKIIKWITGLLLIALSLKLASLTLAQGDYYRDLSTNKRAKNVYTTAPRGEIRDRNGLLLAGNKPMFTVQLMKDEIDLKKQPEKNAAMLNLIRILEADAVKHLNEFPISLNTFEYADNSDYLNTTESPFDKVVEIIRENNLLPRILDTYYVNDSDSGHFEYLPVLNAISSLEARSIDVPLNVAFNGSVIVYEFKDDVNLDIWFRDNYLNRELSGKEVLLQLIAQDELTVIKKIMDHPISRGLIYDLIESSGLAENIVLNEFSYQYYQDYINTKRSYMKLYPDINMNTTAKQDFAILFKANSFKNLLNSKVEAEQKTLPIEALLEVLKTNGVETSIQYEKVDGEYILKDEANGVFDSRQLVDELYRLTINNDLLEEYLENPEISVMAQTQMIEDGLNTKISVSKGKEYTSINNLTQWLADHKITEELSAEEAFETIAEKYKLPEGLSRYEKMGVMNIYYEINKQGHLAYVPINFAYGLEEDTVAKIEEQLSYFLGFNISVEPVRFYPNGKVAAHVLGYMGKISQSSEIDLYVNERGYSPNALIGKTGVEESFEKNLNGVSGLKRVEIDSIGNTTQIIEEIDPIPGDNVYLSIDLKLQEAAEKALERNLKVVQTGGTYTSEWGDFSPAVSTAKGRPYVNATSGAVMAIDVETGEVLAMASYPAYDPNLFAMNISNADWESLIPENENDPLAPRPLYNVATQTAIPPGSTFKMVTALAALEKGLSPNTAIDDGGFVEIGDTKFGCWLYNTKGQYHGRENLYEAIRDSCNYYFYTLALGENQKTGEGIEVKLEIEDITSTAAMLGLGEKTGMQINVPAEVAAGVPNPDNKLSATRNMMRSWLNANISKYYIGIETLTEENKNKMIDEIVGWLDLDYTMTRSEISNDLTNMNLEAEKKLPGTKEGLADRIKFSYLNQAKWTLADTMNITIGQGANSYTLSQMTNYIATIANRGKLHSLSLVSSIKNHNNSKSLYNHTPEYEEIDVKNKNNFNYLMKGMNMASTNGLNKAAFKDFPVEVGLKTGTSEKSGVNPITKDTYDSYSYQVAFAPYDTPKIAVAAVMFQGGDGSNCSPIIRDVIGEYMGLTKIEEVDVLPIEMEIVK